jgi:hypothetical protein
VRDINTVSVALAAVGALHDTRPGLSVFGFHRLRRGRARRPASLRRPDRPESGAAMWESKAAIFLRTYVI